MQRNINLLVFLLAILPLLFVWDKDFFFHIGNSKPRFSCFPENDFYPYHEFIRSLTTLGNDDETSSTDLDSTTQSGSNKLCSMI